MIDGSEKRPNFRIPMFVKSAVSCFVLFCFVVVVFLQSKQVKRTPRDSVNELII